MKKGLIIIAVILGVILAAVGVTKCSSTRTMRPSERVDLTESFKQDNVPSFTTVQAVVNHQQQQLEEENLKFEFINMDQAVLENVATVCFNKNGPTITIKDIIDEYRSNRSVYDNLPQAPTDTSVEGDTTLNVKQEVQQKARSGSNSDEKYSNTVSYSQKDTVVNVKAKVLVREELVYE